MGGFSVTGNGALKILGGLSMGSRERVVLMQVGEEQILIGVSPGRIQTLHVLDKPISVDDKKNAESGFAERLSEALSSSRRRDK
jgi:flagellar protein FliO/FliZ